MIKNINVVPYDPQWPHMFEREALGIKNALNNSRGENCLAIHHVGSTSVPGLSAKPIIDIIAVVRKGDAAIAPLEPIGFAYKGEWNIPFKFGFTKGVAGVRTVMLHVFEENHPEIELNILFRNYLKSHPEALRQYGQLKAALLTQESSFQKGQGSLFSGYNLGKDDFIRNILIQERYAGHRFLHVNHDAEWQQYHRIKKEQIFDPIGAVYDAHHPTIHAPGHFHFILCQGVDIVTIAHVEFLDHTTATLKSLAVDSSYQNQDYDKKMASLCDRWIKTQTRKFLK